MRMGYIIDEVILPMAILATFGLFIMAFCYGIPATFHVSISPGSGQQIGYISEVENSGFIWRPDEIVLIGSEATFSSAQTAWDYASDSPEITTRAKEYLKSHQKVIVEYETMFVAFGWEYSNPSKIVRITPVGDAP